MPSFAVIAEGVTDQIVLENVLRGYFHGDDDLVVNHLQPPRRAMQKGGQPAPGGWTLVFRSLKAGDHRKALQVHDYVIVQIDTDRSEDPGFDVPHRAPDGRALSPEELVEQVRRRLIVAMAPEFYARHAARILFAIAVDEIECWLLPLLYDNEPAKRSKTTGCLDAADWKLRRLARPPLSTAGSKSPASYEKLSRDYAKHRKLMQHCDENPSLALFVKSLAALGAGSGGDTGGNPTQAPDGSSLPPANGGAARMP
jgi:hypothetical protein